MADKDKKGIADLKKLIKKLKKNGLTITEKNVAKSLRSKFYGFSNLKEFVSELMVNEDFQQKLQQIGLQLFLLFLSFFLLETSTGIFLDLDLLEYPFAFFGLIIIISFFCLFSFSFFRTFFVLSIKI